MLDKNRKLVKSSFGSRLVISFRLNPFDRIGIYRIFYGRVLVCMSSKQAIRLSLRLIPSKRFFVYDMNAIRVIVTKGYSSLFAYFGILQFFPFSSSRARCRCGLKFNNMKQKSPFIRQTCVIYSNLLRQRETEQI